MQFRHEWKHLINYGDYIELKQRLCAVLSPDPHAEPNGTYSVRSLYFDNVCDKVLREKLNGVNNREKFRIRYYKDDPSFLRLEKKQKTGGLCSKLTAQHTQAEAQSIVEGKWAWMKDAAGRHLLAELYQKMLYQGLRPRTIVEYLREPFLYPAGNVRITLDHHLRTGIRCVDFLNPECPLVSTGDPSVILEVKWDEFLPTLVQDLVQIPNRRVTAFSKYAACRLYG